MTNPSLPQHTDAHPLNLMGCFIALLALTAGEVSLFEIWSHTHFVPKFVLVLMLLVLTLPKAAIVLIYFMHLKFEKRFLVVLAVIPLILLFFVVLPPLTDIVTLKNQGKTYNHAYELEGWVPPHKAQHENALASEASHDQHH